MKIEEASNEPPLLNAYVVASLLLLSLFGLSLIILIYVKFHVGENWGGLHYGAGGAGVALAVVLSVLMVRNRAGRWPALAGFLGMAVSLGICVWALRASDYQLTERSYAVLQAAHVPADLIADLKSAEGIVSDSEQQFLTELDSRFGHDHIAPYREALVRSGWNLSCGPMFAGVAGYCASMALCIGPMALTARERIRRHGMEPAVSN